jgi:hypothetical protein
MDATLIGWKVHIDPVRIFRCLLKEHGILDDLSVYGIFECIGIAWLVEGPVGFFGEIDLEISPWLDHIITITGSKYNSCQDK